MNSDTEIVPCHDEVEEIPTVQYQFLPIGEIENKEPNAIVGTFRTISILPKATSIQII